MVRRKIILKMLSSDTYIYNKETVFSLLFNIADFLVILSFLFSNIKRLRKDIYLTENYFLI